jgi:hypothetical protein
VEGNLIGDSSKIDEPVIIKSATLYDEVENITEYASPGVEEDLIGGSSKTVSPMVDGELIGGSDISTISDVEGAVIGGGDKIDESIIKNTTLEEEPENDEEEINEVFEEKPEIKISDLNPNQMRFYLRTGMLPK